MRPSQKRLPEEMHEETGGEAVDASAAEEGADETEETNPTAEETVAVPRLVTRSYSEAVLIARDTGVVERSYLSECTYAAQQRFKELVQCERRMTPSRFSSTVVLWSQSSRRRFKDTVLFLPRLHAKSYSETIYTFAKDTCHVFTSTLTQYTSRERSRWYTSAIELQPNNGATAGPTDHTTTGTTTATITTTAATTTTTTTTTTPASRSSRPSSTSQDETETQP